MLECFHELKKRFAVGRKRVGHLAASIIFIQKAGLNKRFGVLRDSFKICFQRVRNLFHRNPIISFHQKQNINSPVISRAFKITFQLF